MDCLVEYPFRILLQTLTLRTFKLKLYNRTFRNLLIGCVLLTSVSSVSAVVISPDEMLGLRNSVVLTFSAVKYQTEDRTIAHFDISGLTSGITGATLNIGISNIDPAGDDGTFDVYSFSGDGVVSTDEWAVGSLYHSFSSLGSSFQTLTVGIDSILNTAIDNGDSFLSFNFRTADTDRYWLNSVTGGTTQSISGEGPTFINIPTGSAPEPATIVLLGLGLAGIRLTTKKK